ncbi:hypothetical protein FRX31_002932, partial [Thalictrum thalictroides]
MAGDEGSSSSSKVKFNNCFVCGEKDHWKDDCYWRNYQCVKCNKHRMKIFVSSQPKSKGEKFLKCENQPFCNGFEWLSKAKKNKEEENKTMIVEGKNSTVKLRIEGKLPMTVE